MMRASKAVCIIPANEGRMESYHPVTALDNEKCADHHCSACVELGAIAQQELVRIARVRRYRAGETIVAEAEDIDFLGNVVSGVLRLQKTLHDGRQQIVGFLLPPDFFGRIFVKKSNVAIEAATDATVCCISRVAYERLIARFPELEHRMLVNVLRELDAAQDWMLLLATQSVSERVATFLLNLAKRVGVIHNSAPTNITVPVSRRDMAAYLGTTVESISRKLQEMARARIIRVIDAQHFEIINEKALVALSQHNGEEFDHV
jgi:CRP/FNR family transcriptional regulator